MKQHLFFRHLTTIVMMVIGLYFIQIYAFDSTVNLALSKPATARDTWTGDGGVYTATKAVDGSLSTSWMAAVDAGGIGSWLYVDLQNNFMVNKVVIVWNNSRWPSGAWKLQVATNTPDASGNSNWVDVYNGIAGSDVVGGTGTYTFSATAGRYVRMLGTTQSVSYGYHINEMKVYSDCAISQGAAPSIAIFPSSKTLMVGQAYQYQSAIIDANGSVVNATYTPTWSVTPSSTASINISSGLFTANQIGTYTITCNTTYNSISLSASATVNVVVFDGTQNLALNKTATTSGQTASNGNDGSITTRWRSSNANQKEWWQVNLGADYMISNVIIKMNGDAGARGATYNILASLTGLDGSWQTVVSSATIPTGSGTESNSHTFTAVSAHYIKYDGITKGGWDHNFAEFEVRGTGYYNPTPNLTFATPVSVTKNYNDAAFTNVASSSNSAGAISYSSGNTGVATVNSTTGEVTILAAGTSVITSTIAANGAYSSGTATYILTVNGITPNLTFATPTSVTKNYGDVAFTNSASSSNSAGTITYSTGNASVATVNSSTGEVTIVTAGSTVITANIASNGNYNAGTATYTLTVNGIAPNLTFASPTSVRKYYGDAAFTNAASSSNSVGVITYSSDNTSVATVNTSTGQVTLVTVGTAVITANIAANGSYTAGSTTYTLTVVYPIGSIKGTSVPLYIQGNIVGTPPVYGGDIAQPINTATALLDYKVVTRNGKSWVYTKFTGTAALDLSAAWTSQFRYWSVANAKTENNLTTSRNGSTKIVLGSTTATIPSSPRISFFQALNPGGYGETLSTNYNPTIANSTVGGDVTAPSISACDVTATETTADLTITGSDDSGDLFYHIVDAAHSIDEFALSTNITLTSLTTLVTYNLTITPIDFTGNEGTPFSKQFTTAGLVQSLSGIANDIRFVCKSTSTTLEYYYEYTDASKTFSDATLTITPAGGTTFDVKPTISPDGKYCYGTTSDASIANKVVALNFKYLTLGGSWVNSNSVITSGDLTGTAIKHQMGSGLSTTEAVIPILNSVSLVDVTATNAKLNIQGNDNSGTVYYAITGGTSPANGYRTGDYYFLNLATGQNVYTLNVQAKDLSGNTSSNTITQKVKSMKTRSNLTDNQGCAYASTAATANPELVSIVQQSGNTLTLGCTTASNLIGVGAGWRNRIFNTPTVVVNGTTYTLTLDANGTTATKTFTDLVGAIPITSESNFTIRWSVYWGVTGGGQFFTGTYTYDIGDNGQTDAVGPTAPALSLSGSTLSWPACTDQLSGVKWYTVAETGQSVTKTFDFSESTFSYSMANPTNQVVVTAVDFMGNSTSATYNGADINVASDMAASALTTCANCNLNVASGVALTVDVPTTLKNITVASGGSITNSTNNTLTATTLNLNSDETGTATYLDNGTTTITTANVNQYLTSGRNWYISSPVTAATSNVFSASSGHPLYWYDEAHGSTAPWPQITDGETSLTVMKGYVANMATSGAVIFTGTLNSGSKTITVYRTDTQTKAGFNLVGNPYASYLDWDQVSTTNLMTSIWQRTKNAGNTYVFDTYNSLGHMGINNSNKNVNNHIPPMQAFWVRVNDGFTSGSLTVNNSMRSHKGNQIVLGNTVNDPIFKTTTTKTMEQSVLRLQVSNGTNTDETVIYSDPNASNNYDGYDSPKMFNNSASLAEIYTLAGNEQLAINGLNTISYDTEIPLGFSTTSSGTFSIKASQLSSFDAGTQLILKDYQDVNNPVTADLSDGTSYSFTSGVSANNTSRFVVILKAPSVATGVNPASSMDNIWISTNGNKILINGKPDGETSVTIYNSIGQKLFVENKNTKTISEIPIQSGVYMVTVSNSGKSITRKIVIK